MKGHSAILLGLSCLLLGIQPAKADDLNTIIKRMNEFVAQENYPKALEELSWATKEVEKMHSGKIAKVIPATVNGFVGDAPKFQSVMGFSSIERQYKKGSDSIHVSIEGIASSGAGGAAGGLAGIAKMGMMMGGEEGAETTRLDGHTASVRTAGNPEITVVLDSGAILKMRAQGNVDAETLKSFAENMKISDLDNYLRGSK